MPGECQEVALGSEVLSWLSIKMQRMQSLAISAAATAIHGTRALAININPGICGSFTLLSSLSCQGVRLSSENSVKSGGYLFRL